MKQGFLSPIKATSKSADFSSMTIKFNDKVDKITSASDTGSIKRNFTLEKLEASPFLQGSESLSDMLSTLKKSRQPTTGGPGPTTESGWALKLHAAEVLGGKHHATANKLHQKLLKKRKERAPDVGVEPSGLTDWTYKGLKSKYRSEMDREALWQAHQSMQELATVAFESQNSMLPVVPVFRHPMIMQFESFCNKANWNSIMKTRRRLSMKRFVLDVREVWLTNLGHIREHMPENVLDAVVEDANEYYDDGSSSLGIGHHGIALEDAEKQAASGVDGGLSRRRDVKAILGMDHQLQSVATVRATEMAHHPAALFDCKLVLDYEPVPTPYLIIPPPLPPVIEPLISNFPLAMPLTADQQHQHTMSRYFATSRGSEEILPRAGPFALGTNFSSSSKRASINPAHLLNPPAKTTNARRSRIMMDSDVMMSINRMCPSADMLSVVNRMYEQVRRMIGPPAVDLKKKRLHEMQVKRHEMHSHDPAHHVDHADQAAGGADSDTHMNLLPAEMQPVQGEAVDAVLGDRDQHRLGDVFHKDSAYADIVLDPKEVDQALGDGSALEIWWRVELIRRGDMKMAEYYAKESDVAAYIASMLLQPAPEPHATSINSSKYNPLMVFESQSVSLAARSPDGHPAGQVLGDIVVSISLKKSRESQPTVAVAADSGSAVLASAQEDYEGSLAGDNRIRDIVDIEIRALLLATEDEIGCGSCPAEVAAVLDFAAAASYNYDWWADPMRAKDVWASLLLSLQVELDPAAGSVGLCLQRKASPADALLGGLSFSEACNCAHELTNMVHVVEDDVSDSLQLRLLEDPGTVGCIFLPIIKPTQLPEPPPPMPSILHHVAAAEKQAAVMADVSKPHKKPGKKSLKAKKQKEFSGDSAAPGGSGGGDGGAVVSTLAARSVKGNRRSWNRSPSPAPSSRASPAPPSTADAGQSGAEGASGFDAGVTWEEQVTRNEPCLTIQVNGGLKLTHNMPGACEIGVTGLWLKPPVRDPKEYTRAAANFIRDTVHSTTSSVIVLLSLALDTPVQVPVQTAWETFQTYPPRASFELIQDTVPALVTLAKAIHSEPLKSPIDLRLAERVMVFATAADEGFDFAPIDQPVAGKGPRGSPTKAFLRVSKQGMKRQVPFVNELGYRLKIELYLLGINPVVNTNVFGLTNIGSQPNIPGTNARSIWHGTLAIVEHINRPRVPTDYHYILISAKTAMENDACAFSVKLHGQEFVGLVPTASKAFQAEYEEIDERRAVFARQMALDAKIESSEMKMRIRDREVMKSLQKEMQRAIEKKLRKGTRSERGWARRYHMSTLLEIQGEWERRRDDRSGMCFFHKLNSGPAFDAGLASKTGALSSKSGKLGAGTKKKTPLVQEKFLETCQWEVPSSWDGKIEFGEAKGIVEVHALQAALDDLRVKTGGKASTSSENGAGTYDADFVEPDDTWLPDQEHIEKPTNTFGIAPRKFQRPTKKNMAPKMPKPFLNDDGSIRAPVEELYEFDDDGEELAENSLAASVAPSIGGTVTDRGDLATINTARLEHIAEQLVSSDDLIRVLAKRLGLPVSNIVPAEDMSGVHSIGASILDNASNVGSVQSSQTGSGVGVTPYGTKPGKLSRGPVAPRATYEDDFSDAEADSDEDFWSDDEIQAGDVDEEEAVDLPVDHGGMAALKRRDNKAFKGADPPKKFKAGVFVPFLNLIDEDLTSAGFEDNEGVANWRRLPRATLDKTFFAKCVERRTAGPDSTAANTLNAPCALVPLSPVDAIQYVPDPFQAEYQSIFIPNAKKDAERQMATLARNINKETLLTENIPTDDLLLFGQPEENTKLDSVVMKQFKEDQSATKDVVAAAVDKALWAAKGGNISALEDALEEQIHVDTCDQFGNSLLLLAAQQGSKRMVKFLLRRGANFDWQNTSGNTAMHYCYAYNNASLGDYLKSRGANDALLNVDGMTCYEGLSKEYLKVPGDADSEEEDEEAVAQLEWST